jgi:hypothetical protein
MLPFNAIAAMKQAMPQNPTLQFAQNLTSPIGQARKGLFDFIGQSPVGQFQQGLQAGMGTSGQGQAIPQQQPMQMQNFANPAGNQQVYQVYNQMMQAIKQKRGF